MDIDSARAVHGERETRYYVFNEVLFREDEKKTQRGRYERTHINDISSK
jgi:hypothetical protein